MRDLSIARWRDFKGDLSPSPELENKSNTLKIITNKGVSPSAGVDNDTTGCGEIVVFKD